MIPNFSQIIIGVYISLNKTIITNISIPFTMIGEEEDETLLCVTDFYHFCRESCSEAVGQWYFPNGSPVPVSTSTHNNTLYMNKNYGVVRLHRKNNATIETGSYCCEIQDSTRAIQNICVHVCDEDLATCLATPADRKEMDLTVTSSADGRGTESKEKETARNGNVVTVGGAVAGGLILLLVAGIVLICLLACR